MEFVNDIHRPITITHELNSKQTKLLRFLDKDKFGKDITLTTLVDELGIDATGSLYDRKDAVTSVVKEIQSKLTSAKSPYKMKSKWKKDGSSVKITFEKRG